MMQIKFSGGGSAKLDMVFIDAMHAQPAPLIDFLMLYPHMREDAAVIFHDVETYIDESEQGASYFYTGWSGRKRVNYRILDGRISGTEYMGIIDIQRSPQEMYADLIEIARQPITGSKYNYSGKEDPLGIEIEDLDVTLRNYMEKYYPHEFVEEILSVLLENLRQYKEKWIYYKHENRLADCGFSVWKDSVDASRNPDLTHDGRAAIWGAGVYGRRLVRGILELEEEDKIAAWVDNKNKSCLTSAPETLKNCDFDYLIVAVQKLHVYEQIRNEAIELGIPEKKIRWLLEDSE